MALLPRSMRLSSDPSYLSGLNRYQDNARAARDAQVVEQSSSTAAQTAVSSALRVAPTARLDRTADDQRQERAYGREESTREFARESPTGRRPRYIPKGQSVDLTI